MRDLNHRFEFVDPATLGANPRNWKTHPEAQLAAMGGLIDEVGFLIPILFNDRTGRILDGHGRKELALARGWPAVPVLRVDLDEAKEAQALATIDNLGGMADIDPVAFVELLRDVDTASIELQELLAGVAEGLGFGGGRGGAGADGGDDPDDDGDGPDPEPEPDPKRIDDILWPSDNDLGIPVLNPAFQAEGVVFPATMWGTVGAKAPMHGTWINYTRDERLDRHWYDPGQLLLSGPVAAIEPNFSTHPQLPRAVVQWLTYKKRLIARTWQSKGVRIFVDLSVCDCWQEVNLLGVPRGWRAYATRQHSDGDDFASIEAHYQAAVAHAGTADIVFLVYGGYKTARALCQARGWAWEPEEFHVKRGTAAEPLAMQPRGGE